MKRRGVRPTKDQFNRLSPQAKATLLAMDEMGCVGEENSVSEAEIALRVTEREFRRIRAEERKLGKYLSEFTTEDAIRALYEAIKEDHE